MLAAVGFAFWHPGVRPAALLLIPMVLDGGMQQATAYESTNFRRLVTGMLFGYGIFSLFLRSMVWTFRFGFSLGKQWFG